MFNRRRDEVSGKIHQHRQLKVDSLDFDSLNRVSCAGQVNTLHCFSFLCLAASAVSFACAKPWPGRVALAAPFVLSALQALRPDSAEALALRLWQDVE